MVSDKDVRHLGLAGTCLWHEGATGRACGGKRGSDAHNRRDLVTAYNCVAGLRASAGGGSARCGLVPRRPAGAEAMRRESYHFKNLPAKSLSERKAMRGKNYLCKKPPQKHLG